MVCEFRSWLWGQSHSEKIGGGNFVDTACNYNEGTSEKYIGEFIASNRDYFVLATKFTLRVRGDKQNDPNAGGNSRKNIIDQWNPV